MRKTTKVSQYFCRTGLSLVELLAATILAVMMMSAVLVMGGA